MSSSLAWLLGECLFHDLYLLEHLTLTTQAQNTPAAAQTKMERSMLNITYTDRKTNIGPVGQVEDKSQL